MKSFNSYIIEKLKINKDTKVDLKFPVHIEFWYPIKDIYRMRDTIHDYSNVVRFGITDKKEKKESEDLYLFSVEIENKEDLLRLFVFFYYLFVIDDDKAKNFSGMDEEGIKERIENYDEIEDYMDSFSTEEYKDELDKLLVLLKKKK